ncbi:MAG: chromosome segregation SMC family protein, partial [Deefgea sp.]
MRLTHIKLAGFKSFVDPTTIPVPGNLVAVCGPNGCGKSNVIDAVRWVLGESSAKQLRGESMQDVIFNGSTTRKAVSRAAVELVFDNQAGLAAGAWSSYAEISIKRVLTRQGDSSYFINHQAVRRRDITDLFLGTGVGKSGYAIIEQGMISRIIEAKPEELRHFLEEAAGVSKYKERRRETEHRIADTRDNLSRVADIQLELQGQIDKLSSQAGIAQHYQALQQQISEKEQLLALQRKLDASQDFEAAKLNLLQAQTALDAALAGVRESETQLEVLRETHFIASDALHAAQGELYAANAEVARMEQTLLHLKQSRERLSAQMSQCEQDGQKLMASKAQIAADLAHSTAQLEELSISLEEANFKVEEASLALPEQEQALHHADAEWQALRDQLSELNNSQKLLEQQMQFASRNRQSLLSRQTQHNAELARLAPIALDDDWAEQIADAQFELAELEMQHEECTIEQNDGKQKLDATRQTVQLLHTELVQLQARESALLEVLSDIENTGELQAWLAA